MTQTLELTAAELELIENKRKQDILAEEAEKLKKEATAFLDDFKKIAEDFDVKIETQLIVGKPAEEIVKFVKKDDLIIITYHDKIKGIDRVENSKASFGKMKEIYAFRSMKFKDRMSKYMNTPLSMKSETIISNNKQETTPLQ